ncbi:hypothetical protein Q3V23_00940 [Streptomyces sp. VNUA116]|uniref:hypothetical protein n=1 Tax=Streptomyces sp. VNUA116 TaxID=3062449 RepID=UPI0026754203|nr:hypothetical protein [Streptomyces sp. VNUA116]WKU42751.1 hypothetical protein Q3V23_00940 [Streptomyces sp. VNUA116]
MVPWGACGKGPGNGHLAARPTQWAASRCFHAPADADAEDWIAVKTARILRGYAQQAADEIRAEAGHCKLTGD